MKKLVSLLLALTMIVSATSAFACTGFYVGKKASAGGNVIIGHTVDASTTGATNIFVTPRVENEPGRVYESWGFEWPLPDTTYAITGTPFNGGWCDNGVANEMGVAISAATTCYVSPEIAAMDPVVWPGCSEMFLCELVGLCCATAREGVELLGEVIATVGNAEQNTILIADQNEAWYMETYTGHEWCAVKMPEDCVAVYGNQFMLGEVDLSDTENVMYSEGLVSRPEEAGLLVLGENGNIDLFATYSGGLLGNASNRRTWYGHVMLAPSTAGEYDTYTRYPLFYQPDEPVTLAKLFDVTRARFEGTEWDPDKYDRLDQRVIGTEKQANINAIEVYADLPAPMSCVTWNCMGNSEHTVFLPLSNLVTDVAEMYKYNSPDATYDLDMAWTHYKRLTSLAELDRELFGQGVRDYWHSVEVELEATFPSVLAETAALYANDPAAAAAYITEWTIDNQEQYLAEADLIYDELTWYMIKNNVQQKYGYDSAKLAMNDTYTQAPFVPSLAIAE